MTFYFSSMDISKLLCSKEQISTKKLASNFLKLYLNKPEEATGAFIELLFHAGGWMTFKYSSSKFPPVEDFGIIKESGPIDLYPLIYDRDVSFQSSFSSFITLVIESEKGMLLYQEDFMSKIILAFNSLVSGSWDSFRLVALILGMRLLVSLDKEYDSLRLESQFVPDDIQKVSNLNYGSNLRKKRSFLSPPWQQIFLKIYSGAQLCVYHSLCRCYKFMQSAGIDARSICPFHEVLIWSVTLPTEPIQEDRWLPTILHGMRDKCVDNKGIAVMALYQLFRHPIDCSHQRKVFNHVKSDVLYLLKSKSEVAEICLRILNSCIRYMDIELSGSDMDTILYYLYDNSQSMAVLAAEFVFWSQFVPLANDPVAVIVHLVEINHESIIKSEDLLVDSLYHMIKAYLKWNDWIQVIMDAPIDDVPDFMKMLAAFARKATTGFTPRVRKWRVCQQTVDTAEITANSSSYSSLFLDLWFSLLEMRRVNDSPKAIASLLKMIQYFDSSILANVESVENLAQVCLAFLVITEDLEVIEESCHSLASLKSLSKTSGKDVNGLQDVIDAAVRQSVLDFQSSKGDEASSQLIQKKMLSLTKYFDVNDNSLWWLSFDKLRNAPLVKMDQTSKMKKIVSLICLLFQLLMRKVSVAAKDVHLDRDNTTSNVLVNCCMSRTAALQALLKYFLDVQYDNGVRKMAFTALMDLLEFMGPHVASQKRLWAIHISLDEEEVTALVNYASGMMESNKNCVHSLLQDAKLGECCGVIYKMCDFISRGLLDIHCITPFLRCIGRCSTHDEIVMEAVNKYSFNFPNRWEILAVSILNAFVSMLENAMPSFPMIDDTPHRYKFSHLYMSLLNLTQYLVGRNKFDNKNIMKLLSIRLHMHMIDIALRPDGPRAVLELLYAVRETLAAEDVNLVLSFLNQYRPDTGADVTKYYNFLKQSVYKYDSPPNLVPTTAGIIFPVAY